VIDRAFVERAVGLLEAHQIETWIFGGWGEELRGLIRPREHVDLDLLYPAPDWSAVDALQFDWIRGKRFPWKRAFVLEGTTVELFLVERDERGWHTRLQRRRHDWPDNVLAYNGELRIASTVALASFRHSYRVDAVA
jgi:hypothetical protein